MILYAHKNGCRFRKLERADLDMLRELKCDSWVTTHKTAFVNSEDQQKWFDAIPANAMHFICCRKDSIYKTHVRVGLLSITDIDWISRSARIGGSIFAEHRGTEWSTKAWEAGTDFVFEMLNLDRIEGEVLENNPYALAMDLKIGYVIEGRRRQAVWKCNQYLDSFIVSLLHHEWLESPRVQAMGGICNLNFKPRRNVSKVLNRLGVQIPKEFLDPVLVQEVSPVNPESIAERKDLDYADAAFLEELSKLISNDVERVPFNDTYGFMASNLDEADALIDQHPESP